MKRIMVGIFCIGLLVPAAQAGQGPVTGDDGGFVRMRTQAEAARRKEEELQLLQMDVERLKLEVEKKKAVTELGQLSGNAQSPASFSGTEPAVVLKYIFMSTGGITQKEAAFDVDGAPRRAGEGGEVGGRVVKEISPQGVILKAKDGREELLALKK